MGSGTYGAAFRAQSPIKGKSGLHVFHVSSGRVIFLVGVVWLVMALLNILWLRITAVWSISGRFIKVPHL